MMSVRQAIRRVTFPARSSRALDDIRLDEELDEQA
jgi:hypothetical protein